jgi:hypothetical protein
VSSSNLQSCCMYVPAIDWDFFICYGFRFPSGLIDWIIAYAAEYLCAVLWASDALHSFRSLARERLRRYSGTFISIHFTPDFAFLTFSLCWSRSACVSYTTKASSWR